MPRKKPRKKQPRLEDVLSPGEVRHFVFLISKGDPDVEGSKKLLRLFCQRAQRLKFPISPFPQPLLDLLITAFERYLSGEEKDLEKSLGLVSRTKSKPGRPSTRPQKYGAIAEMLVKNLTVPEIAQAQRVPVSTVERVRAIVNALRGRRQHGAKPDDFSWDEADERAGKIQKDRLSAIRTAMITPEDIIPEEWAKNPL